jgi:3-oxoacyl-[acyl-carrier-protein] synthase-1
VLETFDALKQPQSGLIQLNFDDRTSIMAGVVNLTNEELAHHVGSSANLPRAALLGIHAAKEAYLQSGIQHMERWRTGMVSGCVFGGMDKSEQFYPVFREDTSHGRLRDVVCHSTGAITKLVANALQVTDFVTTVNTGGSSALHAMIAGYRLIEQEILDVVFVGGAESLSQLFIQGLNADAMLDPLPARPFDATCSGLNPGEGAGYLVLVSDSVLRRENISPRAVFSGHGAANFIYNSFPSTLKEESAFQSMEGALEHAGLRQSEIDYLNLFGSGIAEFDVVESAAVTELFGTSYPACSSTKAFTGYTGGASGAIESVIALLGISQQCVFPSLGFSKAIPEVGIKPEQDLKFIPIRNVMVNAFGFSGNCASVLFSKAT